MMNYNFKQFQLESIKRKTSLNFDKELKLDSETKNRLHKSVLNNLDVLIEDLLDQGVKFYKISFFEEFNSVKAASIEVEDTIKFSMTEISMLELLYFSIEKNVKGVYNIRCVLATRSLSNFDILSSLRDIFNQSNDDILIDRLTDYSSIPNYWKEILAEKNYKFHRFAYFSKFHQKLYCSLSQLEDTFFPDCGYDLSFFDNALDSNIKGISGQKNSSNKIYAKIEKSRYSYMFWQSISYFDLNISKIFKNLKRKFSIQLKELDVSGLIIDCWEDVYKNFFLKYYHNDIIFLNFVLVFQDGLYFVDRNFFLDYQGNELFLSQGSNFGCYKYVDNLLNNCKNLQPLNWFRLLEVSKSSTNTLEYFSRVLGFCFNSRILKEKNSITVFNDSNFCDLQISLNVSVLDINEKINSVNLCSFEQLEDKKKFVVSACSDVTTQNMYYNTTDSATFFDSVKKLKFVFSDKLLDDRIFFIKLLIYVFTFSCCNKNENANFIIEQELIQIILYCNNLAFHGKAIKFDPNFFFLKKDV